MRIPCLLAVWGLAALGQSPEAGRVERNGNQAILIVENPRPLDSAAITLAEQFGIPVSTEDPPYVFQDDIKDVTAEVSRVPNPQQHTLVPKGGRLEVPFGLRADGSPEDVRALLEALVKQANERFPFAYRLDTDGDWLTLVPTRTRDVPGRSIEITPLLDRHVTIPPGVRTIAESANLMAAALSAQTGLQVGCCQASIGGVPWGLERIAFEARDEPARSVLKRLIAASLEGHPNGYYWGERCSPLPAQSCFINLRHVPIAPVPPAAPPAPPPAAWPAPGAAPWYRLGSQPR